MIELAYISAFGLSTQVTGQKRQPKQSTKKARTDIDIQGDPKK